VEARAVRKAVSSRMHTLDEAFLMTLGGFVRAAGEAGDKAIHGTPDTRPPHVSDQLRLKAGAGLGSKRRPCGLPCLLLAPYPVPFFPLPSKFDAPLLCFLCVPTATSAAVCCGACSMLSAVTPSSQPAS
jgi:hypothetical protein